MVAIDIEGLSKNYGGVDAVQGLDLAIEQGELVALVGPSGCGKTTLLRMVAGFEHPDRGDIRFSGRSVLSLAPERRRVGMVFQDFALFPHMSVAENVGYGLRFSERMARSGRTNRVRELLALVGLGDTEERAPHQLSAGQQQRIALVRALAPNPEVLLLDEPMSALDALLREELRAEIRRVQQSLGITALHVTHDQEEALSIADRVAVMRNGRIEQVGTPEEVYRSPATRFVAEFVGRGNLLRGRVAGADGGEVRVRLDGDQTVTVSSPRPAAAVGEGVELLIRPDRLVCGTGQSAPRGTGNRISGTVQRVEFLGEVSRLRVAHEAGDLIALIDSRGSREWRDRVGEAVTMSFGPDDGWLIPGPPDQPRRG